MFSHAFVGVNDSDILGSKANLASYDYLARSLTSIKSGRYLVDKRMMFL